MNRALSLLVCAALAGCGGASPPAEAPVTAEENETFAVAVRLTEAGTDEDDTPHTRVSLVRIAPDGARHMEALHVETGACWHVGSADSVLIAVRCWWAGAGAQYQITRAGDAIVAERRDVDEATDQAGAWEVVGRVEIPEDAPLQVLTPDRRSELPEP